MYFRKLIPDDFPALMEIIKTSFPNKPDPIERRRAEYISRELETEKNGTFIGYFDDNDKLIASMELYEFDMSFKGSIIKFGGVGFVCTHFLRKKEHSAKAMIQYFTDHFKTRGISVGGLYPFDMAFYHKMGFGFTTENYRFRLLPASIRYNGDKSGLSFARPEDTNEIIICYQSWASKIHGMCCSTANDIKRIFTDTQVVICRQNGKITGYLAFKLLPVKNVVDRYTDMEVTEMVYEDTETFRQLCSFLASQRDQIGRILLYTADPDLYYISLNPDSGENDAYSNGIQELSRHCGGLMMKILDLEAYFSKSPQVEVSSHEPVFLKLEISDDFTSHEPKDLVLKLENGTVTPVQAANHDVNLSCQISDFTSFCTGAVSLEKLVQFDLAKISRMEFITLIQKYLGYEQKPKCLSYY